MSFLVAGGTVGALAGVGATAAGVAGAVGVNALIGAGIGAAAGGLYGATQGGGGGGAAPQIDPNRVGESSLETQIRLAGPQYEAAAQYAPRYAGLYNDTQAQVLFGQSYFNADAALAAMDPNQRAGIEAEAARQGVSPSQWLTSHVSEQAARGDPVARSLQQQYSGTAGGGMLDNYARAAPILSGLQAQANTAQRQADINDVANLGAQATAAYQAANPQLTQAMNTLSGNVNAAANRAAPQITAGPAAAGTLGPAAQAGVENARVNNANAALAGLYQAQGQNASGGPLLSQLESDAARSLGTVSPIQATLAQQAQALLAQGGNLSAEEQRTVQQDARAAAAARGLFDSNPAITSEVLNTDAARRQRLLENQSRALAIDTAGQQQLTNNRSYAQGVQAQGQALSQFNTGQQNQIGLFNAQAGNEQARFNAGNLTNVSLANAQAANQIGIANAGAANQAALANAAAQNQYGLARYGTEADMARYNAGLDYQTQLANAGLTMQNQQQGISNQFNLAGLYASQAQDPFQMVLGRSGAVNQAGGAIGQAQGANIGAPTFDPFNSNIMNIYAGNQANQTATNIAAGNNQAAQNAGLMGMFGSLGAAGIAAFCWVAREVYGPRDARWLAFRRWMIERSADGLLAWYLTHGPKAAALVRGDACLRRTVQRFMDAAIADLEIQPLAA